MTKTRAQKIFSILGKIVMVVAVLIAIMIGVLEMAEGSKDPLRLGLQDYLTQVSGNPAEITTLEGAELFPRVDFLMKDIVIRDKEKQDKALVHADHARMSLDFWNIFLGIRKYNALEATNVQFATGYLLPKKVALKFIGISDPDPTATDIPPQFTVIGAYNDRDLLITGEMRRHGKTSFSYDFARNFPVTFKIGEVEAVGRFVRTLMSAGFQDVTVVSGGETGLFLTKAFTTEPFHIAFTGTVGDIPVSGEIYKENQLVALKIVPGVDNSENLKKLESFVGGLRDNIGIPDTGGNLKIEIGTPYVAPINAENNKE